MEDSLSVFPYSGVCVYCQLINISVSTIYFKVDVEVKKCCMNCHFLACNGSLTGGVMNPVHLTKEAMDRLRQQAEGSDVFHVQNEAHCHRGVWNSNYNSDAHFLDGLEAEVNKKRGGSCFFYPFKKGMLFPTAIELQNRQHRNKAESATRMLSLLALFLALASIWIDGENFKLSLEKIPIVSPLCPP